MAALLRSGLVLALLFAAMAGGPAAAQTGAGARTALPREIGPSGLALPRFVTLRAAKVNRLTQIQARSTGSHESPCRTEIRVTLRG